MGYAGGLVSFYHNSKIKERRQVLTVNALTHKMRRQFHMR